METIVTLITLEFSQREREREKKRNGREGEEKRF